MIAGDFPPAQGQTTRASTTMLAAGVSTTVRVRGAEDTGLESEHLPERCTIEALEGREAEDTAVGDYAHE